VLRQVVSELLKYLGLIVGTASAIWVPSMSLRRMTLKAGNA
jgi:hypothetical protein